MSAKKRIPVTTTAASVRMFQHLGRSGVLPWSTPGNRRTLSSFCTLELACVEWESPDVIGLMARLREEVGARYYLKPASLQKAVSQLPASVAASAQISGSSAILHCSNFPFDLRYQKLTFFYRLNLVDVSGEASNLKQDRVTLHSTSDLRMFALLKKDASEILLCVFEEEDLRPRPCACFTCSSFGPSQRMFRYDELETKFWEDVFTSAFP